VVEYVRRGTRVVGEEVTAPFLVDLMNSLSALDFNSQDYIPLQLRSEDDRLGVLFHALGSDTLSVKSLPPEQLMIALALRWVIRLFSDRARNSGGIKDREKERWTKSEARAFLASFPWITSPYQPKNDTHVSAEDVPPIVDRNVQLMAQVLMALDSIADLSQILLLSERVPDQGRLLSGRRFHSFLTGMKMPTAADIPDGLWDACVEGLEDAFGEERWKKAKRGARVKTVPTVNPVSTRKDVLMASLDIWLPCNFCYYVTLCFITATHLATCGHSSLSHHWVTHVPREVDVGIQQGRIYTTVVVQQSHCKGIQV